MKITKIKLHSHLHFRKDLEVDLTYPKGHQHEGQPLKRVCFLGQSGTGKTTLLNIIKHFVCEDLPFNRSGLDDKAFVDGGAELFYMVDGKNYSKISAGGRKFSHFDRVNPELPKPINYDKPFREILDHFLKESVPLLINFPFCIVPPDDLKEPQFQALDQERGELKIASESESPFTSNRRVWDFDSPTIKLVWHIVFNQVERYLKEYQDKMGDHFKKVYSRPDDAEFVMGEFKKWEQSHPNPLQELADQCLTRILAKFNLEVETDLKAYKMPILSTDKKMHVMIKKKILGQEIPYSFLSTGTKQVMLTAIPLFYLKPKNTIILFDQPETSIYPNIQSLLPELYMDCVDNSNQFFFATHSPIIASSFDPWEVVELRFDDKGEVYRKEYFKGPARHVDAFYIKPKLLRWDSSYRILFDMEAEGNQERTVKLMELASFEKEIEREPNMGKRRELYRQYQSLAEELAWQIGK